MLKNEPFYYAYVPNDLGIYEKLTIISKCDLEEWLQTEALEYEKIRLIADNGNFMELFPIGESDWDVVCRGSESIEIHEKKTFKHFATQRKRDSKIKNANADKPLQDRRHYMKAARGANRKRQSYIPLYKQIQHQENLPTAQSVLDNAKGASSGAWKISLRQVQEISSKYKFNIPTEKKKSKHLGSTGILMWRKGPKDYYLVKFSKHHHTPYKKKRARRG